MRPPGQHEGADLGLQLRHAVEEELPLVFLTRADPAGLQAGQDFMSVFHTARAGQVIITKLNIQTGGREGKKSPCSDARDVSTTLNDLLNNKFSHYSLSSLRSGW